MWPWAGAEGCKAIAPCTSAPYASCILQTRPPQGQTGGWSDLVCGDVEARINSQGGKAREEPAICDLRAARGWVAKGIQFPTQRQPAGAEIAKAQSVKTAPLYL